MTQFPPINRQALIAEAHTIVDILNQGGYEGPAGYVWLQPDLDRLAAGTRHYSAAETQALSKLPPTQHATGHTRISVTRETTLAAAHRMLTESRVPVAALNFASATNPGGGFLTGSAAQEESLARASGLYSALLQYPAYYASHQQAGNRLYSDQLIFSRDVPILRDAAGAWLASPAHFDVLTAAAPNLRNLSEQELAQLRPAAEAALAQRAALVLALFAHHRCSRLILGAWGCGAFRNDPEHVAGVFAQLLQGPYDNVFDEVVFAVFATPAEERNLRAFERHLLR
ncbi:TIGR02452 family protein [Deinococcus sonorensis]|uniref:TIGR02452 family protein n=2 Tax=Deinococcus sonorensis TaxID=309891 RepID=A0AAU7UDZ9_9DEIO